MRRANGRLSRMVPGNRHALNLGQASGAAGLSLDEAAAVSRVLGIAVGPLARFTLADVLRWLDQAEAGGRGPELFAGGAR